MSVVFSLFHELTSSVDYLKLVAVWQIVSSMKYGEVLIFLNIICIYMCVCMYVLYVTYVCYMYVLHIHMYYNHCVIN